MTGCWNCWKCGAELDEDGWHSCDVDPVKKALDAIERAKARTDEMGSRLNVLRSKLGLGQEYSSLVSDFKKMVLLLDSLKENLTEDIADETLVLVQQKAQDISSRAQELLDLKKASSCEDKG